MPMKPILKHQHERIIRFKPNMLLQPAVYEAMVLDGVSAWNVYGPEEALVHDSHSADFPNLRRVLRELGGSYHFFSRPAGHDDHAQWRHVRKGGEETITNYGQDFPLLE